MSGSEIQSQGPIFDLLTSRSWRERRLADHWHSKPYLDDIEHFKGELGSQHVADLPYQVALSYLKSRIRAPYDDMPQQLLWTLLVLDPGKASEVVGLATIFPELPKRIEALISVAEWCDQMGQTDASLKALTEARILFTSTANRRNGAEASEDVGIRICRLLARFGAWDYEVLAYLHRRTIESIRYETEVYAREGESEQLAAPEVRTGTRWWDKVIKPVVGDLAAAARMQDARYIKASFFDGWHPNGVMSVDAEYHSLLVRGALTACLYDFAEAELVHVASEERAALWAEYCQKLVQMDEEQRFQRVWAENGKWLLSREYLNTAVGADVHWLFPELATGKWKEHASKQIYAKATLKRNLLDSFVKTQFWACLWQHRFDDARHLLDVIAAMEQGEIAGLPVSSEVELAMRLEQLTGEYIRFRRHSDFGTWSNYENVTATYRLLVLDKAGLLSQLSGFSAQSDESDRRRSYDVRGLASVAASLPSLSVLRNPTLAMAWIRTAPKDHARVVVASYLVHTLARSGKFEDAEKIRAEVNEDYSHLIRDALVDGLVLREGVDAARAYVESTVDADALWWSANGYWDAARALTMFGDVNAVAELMVKGDSWQGSHRDTAWIDWAGRLSTGISATQLAERLRIAGWEVTRKVALNLATTDVGYARDFLVSSIALAKTPTWGLHLPGELDYEKPDDAEEFSRWLGIDLSKEPLLHADQAIHLVKNAQIDNPDSGTLVDLSCEGASVMGYQVRRWSLNENDVAEILSTFDRLSEMNSDDLPADSEGMAEQCLFVELANCVIYFFSAPSLCRARLEMIAARAADSPQNFLQPYQPAATVLLAWGLALCGQVKEACSILPILFDPLIDEDDPEALESRDQLILHAYRQILVAAPPSDARAGLLNKVLAETLKISDLMRLLFVFGKREAAGAELILQRITERLQGAESPSDELLAPSAPRMLPLVDDGEGHTQAGDTNWSTEWVIELLHFDSLCRRLWAAGHVEWLSQLRQSVVQDEELSSRLGEVIDQPSSSADDLARALYSLGEFIPHNENDLTEDTWPYLGFIEAASGVTTLEDLWTLSKAFESIHGVSARMVLLQACAGSLPQGALANLVTSLMEEHEEEYRFDQVMWLGAIAQRQAEAQVEQEATHFEPQLLVSRALKVLEGQLPELNDPILLGDRRGLRSSPDVTRALSMAILFRCLTADALAAERRAVEELLVRQVSEIIENSTWDNWYEATYLLRVLETAGGKELTAEIRRIFKQLKEPFLNNAPPPDA